MIEEKFEVRGGAEDSTTVSHTQYNIATVTCIRTNHQSPITNHQSPITNHQSPITNHQSPITSHQSPVTSHQSHTCRVNDDAYGKSGGASKK
jgi:hypothetical protein